MSQSGDTIAKSELNSGRTSAAQESVEELEGKFDDIPDGSVFVGDLCKEVLETDLTNTFSAFGEVIDVVIKRSRTTSHSLGYGFVTMRTLEQAQLCLEKADDVVLKGRRIRIAKAQRNTKLIVSNLSPATSVVHLNSAFSPYGKIVEEETAVATCANGSLVGHVTFVHRGGAEQAKMALQGRSLLGHPLRIDWKRSSSAFPPPSPTSRGQVEGGTSGSICTGSGGGGGRRPSSGRYASLAEGSGNQYQPRQLSGAEGGHSSPVVSVHVKFQCRSNAAIDESVLCGIYQQFGQVTAVSIKASQYHSAFDELRGYAFVHYEISQWGRQAAFNAVNAMSDVVYDGVRYMTQLSRNFMRMEERAVAAAAYATAASSSIMYTGTAAVGTASYSPLLCAHAAGAGAGSSSQGYGQSRGCLNGFPSFPDASSATTTGPSMISLLQAQQQQSCCRQNVSNGNRGYNSFNQLQGGYASHSLGSYGAPNISMDTGSSYAPFLSSERVGTVVSTPVSLGLACGGAAYYCSTVPAPSGRSDMTTAAKSPPTLETGEEDQRRPTEATRLDSPSCVNLHRGSTQGMAAEFVAVGTSITMHECEELSAEGPAAKELVTAATNGAAAPESAAIDDKNDSK